MPANRYTASSVWNVKKNPNLVLNNTRNTQKKGITFSMEEQHKKHIKKIKWNSDIYISVFYVIIKLNSPRLPSKLQI